MAKCQYKYESYVPIEIKPECDEDSTSNREYCVFHDKDHYAEQEQQATERFDEKVRESINENKPLECIGYYLLAINFAKLLEGKSFAQPVYFNEAIFYSGANFSSTQFNGEANFFGAQFNGIVDFSSTQFNGGANFVSANFNGEANFSKATFSEGEANFQNASFSKVANFSSATFSEKAIFLSA